MRSACLVLGALCAAAALAAFAYLCATGAARDALGVVGCFAPCIAWAAFDAGRVSRQ